MPKSNKKDGFIMQAGILATAGIIVRIIGILYNSPLTAIIGDEGNGYYTNAYNIYTIILLVSSYSIPSAIAKVIAQKLAIREYRNAHRIFVCALLYVLVIGGIASLFVFFCADLLASGNSAMVLRVLSPTIFFYGILGVLRGYFQAHKTMMQTSVSQILEQIINAAVSIGMAYVFIQMVSEESGTTRAIYGAMGGAIGTGAGVLVALLFMWGVYGMNRKMIHRRIDRDHSANEDSYGAILKMIMLVVTPFILSTFVYNASTSVNQTLYMRIMMHIKGIAEAEAASLYSALAKAVKVSNIPIALASAMSAAILPGIAGDFSQGKLKEARTKVSKAMRMTMLISIPAAVGIGILAEPIMWVLYPQPDSIVMASRLLMVLAASVVFYAMSTLSNAVLQGVGKLNAPVINAAISLVIQTALLFVLLMYTDLGLYSLAIVTVLYSLLMCIFNGLSVRKQLHYKQEWDKTFLRPIVASLVMGIVVYGVYQGLYYVTANNLISLAAAICIGGGLYFVLIIKWRVLGEAELKGFPKGAFLVSIARKTGLIKTEVRKKKEKKKEKKESINTSNAAEEADYWLDE